MIQEAYSCPLRIKEDKGEGVTAVLEIKEKKVKPRGYSCVRNRLLTAVFPSLSQSSISASLFTNSSTAWANNLFTFLKFRVKLIKNFRTFGIPDMAQKRGKETTITYL